MSALDRYDSNKPKEVLRIADPTVSCLFANQALSEALAANQVSNFFQKLNQQIDLDSFPSNVNVFVQKRGVSGEITASLDIDFFGNRLVTYFQGEEKSVNLSNALGIIRDLSEIFSKIQSSTTNSETQKLPSIEDEFTNALDSTSDTKLTIDGKEVIAFYPLKERVVLSTSRGWSSMPIEKIQNCAHLFNREFAQSICPLLELDSSVNNLLNGINKLYLGRCILGLGKSIVTQSWSQLAHEREFHRIVCLIKIPGSAFYTAPLRTLS